MKKITISIKILFLIILLTGCIEVTPTPDSEYYQRVQGKGGFVYRGVGYQIIEVDGIEYISCGNGGICPLKK
jgi:hypothetical protein